MFGHSVCVQQNGTDRPNAPIRYCSNEQKTETLLRNVSFAISVTTIALDQITKGQRLNGSDHTVASRRREEVSLLGQLG